MDILISSNLERLLYELAGPEAVRGWMAELADQKRFRSTATRSRAVRELLTRRLRHQRRVALATIKRVCDETGYLMDPHTAVAWEVAERLRGDDPVLVVSTAHWAKFGADVYKALLGVAYAEDLPAEYAGLTGVELLARVQELATQGAVRAARARRARLGAGALRRRGGRRTRGRRGRGPGVARGGTIAAAR